MGSGSLSVTTRRAVLAVILAAAVSTGSGLRAQAPASAADQFLFTSDAAQVVFQVKPDKATDFEAAWTEIKTKTSASDKPEWKSLGDSIQLFKVVQAGAGPTDPAIYVLLMSPPAKASYDPVKILYATKEQGGLWERAAADATFKKISESLAGINVLPMSKVTK